MKHPLSPSDIEVLIWCHCRSSRHERYDAPAVHEAQVMFLNCKMIEMKDGNNFYTTTDKGNAMIKKLCNTIEPVCIWQ